MTVTLQEQSDLPVVSQFLYGTQTPQSRKLTP
jgi:hypothetical protein